MPRIGRATPACKRSVKACVSRLLDLVVLLRTSEIREKIPRCLRTLGYHFLPKRLLNQKMWQAEYRRILENARPAPLQTSITLGIIKDFAFRFANYEAACLELGVPYKLVSITSTNWVKEFEDSGCDAFLVWPSHVNSISKAMFDTRLKVLTEEMHKTLFPSCKALWLYESKCRMSDWLAVNGLPHPETWIFYEPEEAMAFLEGAAFPLVFKTDLGSTASGVRIVRSKTEAERLIEEGDMEGAEALLDAEVVVTPTVPVAKVDKTTRSAAGAVTARTDIRVEVVDKRAVITAVFDGKLPDIILDVNVGAAKRYAKAGGLKAMQGFSITETAVISGRTG